MNEKPDEQNKIKLFVVDDHQMFLDGLKTLLSKNKSFEIVGEALNGKIALEKLQEAKPDLVITDINMPELSGTELTQEIKKEYPDIKVLVLTMYNEREIIHEIIMSEAEGYILKNSGKNELTTALEKIADGGTYYSNEVVSILAENYVQKEKVQERTKDLSAREIEILQLVCQEFSTVQIAEKLCISPLTVETHRKNILKKTKVKTIVGLIRFAIENKIA